MRVDVNSIKVPTNRLRKMTKKAVDVLADSMNQGGMYNPIIVNDGVLVAGAHRLEAARQLGWSDIDVSFQGNIQEPATLELIEIDENLIRSELTDSERSHHTARRIELVAKLKLPEMIKKVADAKVESGAIRKKAADEILESATVDRHPQTIVSHPDDDSLSEKEAIELGHELEKLQTVDMIDDGEYGEVRLVEAIKPISSSKKKVIAGAARPPRVTGSLV